MAMQNLRSRIRWVVTRIRNGNFQVWRIFHDDRFSALNYEDFQLLTLNLLCLKKFYVCEPWFHWSDDQSEQMFFELCEEQAPVKEGRKIVQCYLFAPRFAVERTKSEASGYILPSGRSGTDG